MAQEHKELLLKDLCSRLLYKVIVDYGYNAFDAHNGNHVKHGSKCILTCSLLDVFISPRQNEKGEYIKPYLFPLYSITEEQKQYLKNRFCYDWDGDPYDLLRNQIEIGDTDELIDWFNKNHFDYRGLIEKGLAIDATGLNIYKL